MKRPLLCLAMAAFAAVLCSFPAYAGTTGFVLSGSIVDSDGSPVAGGEVFIYTTRATRRAADFISPPTGRDGRYRVELPPGTYWCVARVRSGGKYGPLVPEGKHSGEPREIEAAAGDEGVLDFAVADVREMARSLRKPAEGYGSVTGRVLDRNGKPVGNAYAFARKERNDERIPEFLSPSVDAAGRFSLYLPPGKYCLGGAVAFPPEKGAACAELVVEHGKIDIANDIRLNYSENTMERERQSGPAGD